MGAGNAIQSFNLRFGPVLFPLIVGMVFLNALQKSPEVALVLARILVLFALERSVLDIRATVLAPVLWC